MFLINFMRVYTTLGYPKPKKRQANDYDILNAGSRNHPLGKIKVDLCYIVLLTLTKMMDIT